MRIDERIIFKMDLQETGAETERLVELSAAKIVKPGVCE